MRLSLRLTLTILFVALVPTIPFIFGVPDSPTSSAANRRPVVENSSWDGSVYQVKAWYRKHLKDPGSVEYISWSPVVRNKNGTFMVRVRYRAKNSFGGYVIGEDVCGLSANGRVLDCVPY